MAGYIRAEAGSVPKLQLKRTGNAAGNGYIECLGSDDSVDYKIAFGQSAGTMSFSTAAGDALNINSSGNISTPNRFTMSGTGSGPGLFMGGWQIFDNASESYGPANGLSFYKGGARVAFHPSGGITFNGDTARSS